ncbi:MAG: efflux RND transporter periplasmic adaptor subunit [Pseudomonadales bacterium]
MRCRVLAAAGMLLALTVGVAAGRWWSGGLPSGEGASGEREVLYWKAPMDPNYRRDKPGKSPMGMDLVPVYADEGPGEAPGVVSIDPQVVSNLGVRTAAVEQGILSRRIETVGYVGYDEDTLHQISTRVDGWIEKLSVKAAGDPVREGQVLFELYSPTLVNAQEEYLVALQNGNAVLLSASRERLAALGVTAGEIERLDRERRVDQRIRVFARSDGVLANLGVREGSYIVPATAVMSIADLDSVWVLAEVFERQAAWVRPGQRAEVTLDYLPGRQWRGSVDYIYPELDQRTRTLKVRLRFDNPGAVLRPNMFSRVVIFGEATPPVVHVPREALIRGGRLDRVVLALGQGRFRSQPVEVGLESGDRVEIRTGLAAGDRVVTSGQFLIDSESNIETSLARLNERSSAPPETVRVAAVVRGIDSAERAIELKHGPVPEWSWPAMTMPFPVQDPQILDTVSLGEPVMATIGRFEGDRYVVLEILPAGAEPDQDAAGHQHQHTADTVQ